MSEFSVKAMDLIAQGNQIISCASTFNALGLRVNQVRNQLALSSSATSAIRASLQTSTNCLNTEEHQMRSYGLTLGQIGLEYQQTEVKISAWGRAGQGSSSDPAGAAPVSTGTGGPSGVAAPETQSEAVDPFEVVNTLIKAGKSYTKRKGDASGETAFSGVDFTSKLVEYAVKLSGGKGGCEGYENQAEAVAGWLGLFDPAAKTWNRMYQYFEDKMHPEEAERLARKFGDIPGMIGLIGGGSAVIGNVVSMWGTMHDSNAAKSEKINAGLDVGESVVDFGATFAKVQYGSQKVIQNTKVKNQILITKEFALTEKAAAVAGKAAVVTALTDVIFGGAKSGVTWYENVSADGVIDGKDIMSTVVSTCNGGLSKVTGFFSLGIAEYDPQAATQFMMDRVDSRLQRNDPLMNYIRKTNNPVTAFGASLLVADGIVGEAVIEGTKQLGRKACEAGRKIGGGLKTVAAWIGM